MAGRQFTLGSDHSSFVIRQSDGNGLVAEAGTNNLISTDDTHDVVIHTGDQFGPFQVESEFATERPHVEVDRWDDIVELTVRSSGPLVVTELIGDDPSEQLTTGAGTFRVRVCARGREMARRREAFGDNESGAVAATEMFHISAWPADELPFSVLKESALTDPSEFRPRLTRDDVVIEGEEGARLIALDLAGGPDARTLSAETGQIEITATLPGTRRHWFSRFTSKPVSRTEDWHYAGTFHIREPGVRSWVSVAGEYRSDQLPGRHGYIEHEYLEIRSPSLMSSLWSWYGPLPRQSHAVITQGRPLVTDTRVDVTYNQTKDSSGQPMTTLHVSHSGLPVEWLNDMAGWWTWQLALADRLEHNTP